MTHPHLNPGDASLLNEEHGAVDAHAPQLRDYARVLHKRRWTVAAAFVTYVAAAMAYSFTATPMYEARAQVLIDVDRPNVVQFEEVVASGGTGDDYYQTQYNLLESRSLARKTITTLDLWSHPQLAGAPEGGTGAALMRWARGLVGSGSAAGGDGETASESVVIDRYLEQLIVSPLRTSRLTDIRFVSSDPSLATRIVNEHVNAFIEQSLEYRFLATK